MPDPLQLNTIHRCVEYMRGKLFLKNPVPAHLLKQLVLSKNSKNLNGVLNQITVVIPQTVQFDVLQPQSRLFNIEQNISIPQAGVALDAHLLLGKLHYATGHFEESLRHFMEADLQSLTEKPLPSRSLKIVAESYAVKGTYSPQPTVPSIHMGPILETALQRAPLLHILGGRLPAAVNRYRNMLQAVESSGTHSLRLTLTRQLAEVLLRGYTGTKYTPPNGDTKSKKTASPSPWKPQAYVGPNLFIPRNECEEIILLLLISDAMAGREAVLSQSPEFKEARIRALSNATAVYDLLTIVLARWNQISLLHESLERALKFSYEEPHIWFQRALCLENMGQYGLALTVTKEVARMLNTKVMPCLLAAKICFQHLNDAYEGIEWSEMALQRELSNPQGLLSRCYLYIGIGNHYAAVTTHLKNNKLTYNNAAMEALNKAQQVDPNDHLIEYYIAMICSCRGQILEAMTHIKSALKLCPEHAPSLHLMILLLTAQKQYAEASALLHSSLSDFPDSLDLHYVKAHLELQVQGGDRGLVHEKKNEFIEARQCFQNAISINPSHVKSLQHLGLMYHYLGNQRMAEKTLRDAARIDPYSPTTWFNLGKVLESLGDHTRASDCMATALQVETVNPILPYTSISITFE
ncbi:unnamed protein product [Nesidiocoris tenuis]|uniref:Tetratricopeptide repeat protein 7 N-terminal domain-containing protein n=1 Tax=Nesidiocoris tenuis TaxID=355587 RepID=A0A6H5HLY5_9HEMI|nr:unnamed protein product [Nesidiocoris tenuis]